MTSTFLFLTLTINIIHLFNFFRISAHVDLHELNVLCPFMIFQSCRKFVEGLGEFHAGYASWVKEIRKDIFVLVNHFLQLAEVVDIFDIFLEE